MKNQPPLHAKKKENNGNIIKKKFLNHPLLLQHSTRSNNTPNNKKKVLHLYIFFDIKTILVEMFVTPLLISSLFFFIYIFVLHFLSRIYSESIRVQEKKKLGEGEKCKKKKKKGKGISSQHVVRITRGGKVSKKNKV